MRVKKPKLNSFVVIALPSNITATFGFVHQNEGTYQKGFDFKAAKQMLDFSNYKLSPTLSRAPFFCNDLHNQSVETLNAIDVLLSIELRRKGQKPKFKSDHLISHKESLFKEYSKSVFLSEPTQKMVSRLPIIGTYFKAYKLVNRKVEVKEYFSDTIEKLYRAVRDATINGYKIRYSDAM